MNRPALLPGRAHRLEKAGTSNGVSCDESGPRIGPVRLLRKTVFGFEPRPAAELDFVFTKAFGAPLDWERRMPGLLAIAKALDENNLALAMIGTLHLRLPALNAERARRAQHAERLLKANFNPLESRDERGWWTSGGGAQIIPVQDVVVEPWIEDFPLQPIPYPTEIVPPAAGTPDLAIPRTRRPPLENPYPEKRRCVKEWKEAYKFCDDLWRKRRLGLDTPKGMGKTYDQCVRGQVSAECGGNPTA